MTSVVSTLLIIFLFLLTPVTLVITPLGADFTRLESFGKVDAFAETLVGFEIFHLVITKAFKRRKYCLRGLIFPDSLLNKVVS